jgi:tetratricopeptide (TPR) repeat protein
MIDSADRKLLSWGHPMAYEPELERLERRYQDDPARNFAQLAEAYRKAGRLDDALTMLQGHLTERPNYVSGLVVLGRCLLDQQNDAEARETFERVLGVDSEHIIALRALGEIAERGGDPDEARRWFTRLLDVDPMNDDAELALQRLAEADADGVSVPDVDAESAAPSGSEPSVTPVTYPVPRIEEPGPVGGSSGEDSRKPATADREEAPPREPDFLVEQSDEQFMPRASGAHPRDVEVIGELDIKSQLEEEESPIGAVPDVDDEPDSLPTGEREVDLGLADVRDAADQLAAEGPGRAPGTQADIGLTPFDDALGWGAGDRISRQISGEDLDEIDKTHEDTVAPVSELPGLEQTEVPQGDAGSAVRPVDGLEGIEAGAIEPVAGLEPTAEGELPADQSVQFVEPEPEAVEVVNEEVVPVVPEVPDESRETAMDAAGEVVDRATAERRASLIGLPLLQGAEALEPDEPLVLDAEPDPVVTETMAELYVRQGLVEEAQDVYQRLLADRPGDARLEARLAQLRADASRTRASGRYDAATSGGQSARAMLMAVLAARPGVSPSPEEAAAATEAPAPADRVDESGRITDPALAAPAVPEPLDEAFGAESEDSILGAPTQPASDEVTLSAIFGEPSAPAPQERASPRAAEPQAAGGRTPGGFSFDEFFGKPAASAPAGGTRAQRDTLSDDEGEEAFRDWLKGLKG